MTRPARTNCRATAEGVPMLFYGTAGIILNARVGCPRLWLEHRTTSGQTFLSITAMMAGLHYLNCVSL